MVEVKDSPSISGIITSEMMRSGCRCSKLSNAFWALLKESTLYFSVNISDTNHSMEGSSSITMTVCLFASNSWVYFRAILAPLRWECLEKPLRMQLRYFLSVGGSEGRLTVKVVSSPGVLSMFMSPSNSVTMFCRWPTPVRFLSFCRSSPRSRESYSGRISFRDFPV